MIDLTIPATDGFSLAATQFGGDGDAAERVVLIAPATGVKRRLYRPFSEFLAAGGFGVVTWDWRGTGDSRPASLRGFEATMRQWGERDRKSTRLNSSHANISYAVFCLKKKNTIAVVV